MEETASNWKEEASDAVEAVEDAASPPPLEPIVWEVTEGKDSEGAEADDGASSETEPPAAASEDTAEVPVPAPPAQEETAEVKVSSEETDSSVESDNDSSSGFQVPPLAGVAAAGAAVATATVGLASSEEKDNEDETAEPKDDSSEPVAVAEAISTSPPPIPGAATPPPVVVPPLPARTTPSDDATKTEVAAAETDSDDGSGFTNVFFDANSAYLKESELEKIQSIAESNSNKEVKVQGLDDLASSNDFKRLLASRRVLAITKRLGESGIENDRIEIKDIELSDEGRVLTPPSVSIRS